MGRLRVLQTTPEIHDPERPGETTEAGCPGSWYRSSWALSVSTYERMLSDSGFSENLHLTRSSDRLLLDATAYLEGQRIRSRNNDQRVAAEARSSGNT